MHLYLFASRPIDLFGNHFNRVFQGCYATELLLRSKDELLKWYPSIFSDPCKWQGDKLGTDMRANHYAMSQLVECLRLVEHDLPSLKYPYTDSLFF